MGKIWYLLKCQEGNEADYMNGCPEFMELKKTEGILCFQYQRMIRYGGKWHLEKRMVLPGYIFVAGTDVLTKSKLQENFRQKCKASLTPCEVPYLKGMCKTGSLIEISRGVIRDGTTVVTSGPLKDREFLIRKIDRHKRTAKIEIPFVGGQKQITVGLEIYEKEI